VSAPPVSDRTRVLVAGSATMIGAALVRRFGVDAAYAVVGADGQPDWSDADDVDAFVAVCRPEHVVVAAGRTAGIAGNQRCPADIMLDNLLVAAHVLPAARRHGVRKLLYLASSCTYPREAVEPFRTDALWTGPLEETSAAYATAKLAAMRLCEAYRRQDGVQFSSAIVADVFGPGDDFRAESDGHVVSALMSRLHAARVAASPSVTIWGSGVPRREFLYVDDLADAVAFLMRRDCGEPAINIGTGVTTSIHELAELLREIVGFEGTLVFDASRSDGAPVKCLDSTPLRALGWRARWEIHAALESTYRWFMANGLGRQLETGR
jgi:GDP-L-fucose synthase